MRWVAVGALCFVGVLACSHDWDIVPPGGGGDAGPTTDGAGSSGSTTSSTGGSTSSSGQPPPPPPKQCPSDCSCGSGETCSFECTSDCLINCADHATCTVAANGHACTATSGSASADCSAGNVTCRVIKNGQEMQCR